MKNSYILSLKIYLHPRDWYLGIFTDDLGTYGFQVWFFALTLYIWKRPKPILDPAINDYTEVKSYCCDRSIFITSKPKCANCSSNDIKFVNKYTCCGCEKEVNQAGGHHF